MLKKTLTVIIAATAFFGLNVNANAEIATIDNQYYSDIERCSNYWNLEGAAVPDSVVKKGIYIHCDRKVLK